jgi:hypothetical protein
MAKGKKTGGRKKGSRNKATIALEQELAASGSCRARDDLGDVVFRHVCTHKAHIRARRDYEPTREAAMTALAKSWRRG